MELTAGGQSMSLADLVRAEEQGLDLNRLLFVKYLVLTRRLTEECLLDPDTEPEPLGAAA